MNPKFTNRLNIFNYKFLNSNYLILQKEKLNNRKKAIISSISNIPVLISQNENEVTLTTSKTKIIFNKVIIIY